MRPRFPIAASIGAAALAVCLLSPTAASATAGEVGSCVGGAVTNADGSVDITNEVNFIVGDQVFEPGCVTVNSVSGVKLVFKDAITYPGWSYRVKDAGGTGKLKVSVEFTNPAVAYKVTYVIQPGRVDWKVSNA